jgi:hypothetical protein
VGDMSRVASAWGYLRGRRASRRHHPF